MKNYHFIIILIATIFQCDSLHSQNSIYDSKWDTLITRHQNPLGKFPKIWLEDESKSLVSESGGFVYKVHTFFEEDCFDEELEYYHSCEKVDTLDVASDSIITTDWGKSTLIFERGKMQILEQKDILKKLISSDEEIISSKKVYFNDDNLNDLVVFSKKTQPSYTNENEIDIFYKCSAFLNTGNGYEFSICGWYDKPPVTVCVTSFKIKGMSMIIAFEDWSRWEENAYQLEFVKMKAGPN